jgi:DNA polymerase-3 subunit epsilon
VHDPATPLAEVTFAVIDLETTGCSPADCGITEVGALKFRGGERVGTIQTLVDPGIEIPTRIVQLTGIHDGMVHGAPTIAAVLPTLLEFIGDAVIVGHNVRFDLGFLHADLAALDYLPIANGFVDTLALARRLVRDEVQNCRLGTLAEHFHVTDDPCHRAFSDAAATAEVFHALLERAAGFGVFALDDLFAFPTTGGHPEAAKLRWVAALPRRPGTYVLRGLDGEVLYVGAGDNLRADVRHLFERKERRGAGGALGLAHALEHEVHSSSDGAHARALELIEACRPRFNGARRRRRVTSEAARASGAQ